VFHHFPYISAKDEEAGEIPVGFVVKKVGSVLSPKDVIDFVAKQVLLYKTDMRSMIFELMSLLESMLVLEWFSNFNPFLLAGCSIQEGSQSGLHRQDSKVCDWEDPPKATQKLLAF
jgi:hypothetical protein